MTTLSKGSVHALDLAIGPGVVHRAQAMLDAMVFAAALEEMPEGKTIALATGELNAIIGGQNRVVLVGYGRHQDA